jgi:type IV pilus assembly protein PilQ
MLTSGSLFAGDAPVVHVKAVVKDGAVNLEAQANGPFEYTTYRPSESLYVLDLSGVSAGDSSGARVIPSELVKSYRLTTYSAGQKPVVRLEILLRPGVEPRLQRNDKNELMLSVSANGNADASAKPVEITMPPAAAPQASVKTVSTKAQTAVVAPAGTEAIKQVTLGQNGDQTEVNVLGSGKLNYHVTRLQNPERIVIDFSGAHLKTSEKTIASNLEPVREIRLGQFTPDVSRVVIDLRGPAHFNVNQTENGITVAFAAPAAVKSTPENQPAEVTTTKADSKTDTKASIAPAQSSAQSSGQSISIPAPVAALPAALAGTSTALASPAIAQPAAKIEAAKPSAAPSVVVSIPGVTPDAAAASAAAAQQAATPPPAGRYSGEPISVNLKDVDLRDFFRLIHEISGLNVVVDPAVKGSLTIVLDDVPWDQALDISWTATCCGSRPRTR